MAIEYPVYSAHDLCVSVFIPLNCDGTVDSEQPTIPHCSLTAVRIIPQVTAEVIDEDPSGQAGVNCAYRRIPPQPNGCVVEFDACSRENPQLWSRMGQAQLITDPNDPTCVLGMEEVTNNSDSCGSCSLEEGTCRHKMALITISNAWCGTERHPTYPYVAQIIPSLEFEPSTETRTRARGFQTRTFRAIAQSNPMFADPYAIDPRGAGSESCWKEILIKTENFEANVGDITALFESCACGKCPASQLVAA